MDGTLLTQLGDKVDEIRGHLDAAKASGWSLNEADTEHKVIDPLLYALGYGPFDIRKRGHDSVANNFPDYTLLPHTTQQWFLEVKKLDLNLQDGEAAQAVNYANNQGAAWAVLTNGRRWYIYNAHLPKPLTDKRVFQIDDLFGDSSALETLAMLSRSSMLGNGLSEAWAFQQVQGIVKAQLETPHSPVRKRLRQLASDETGAAVSDALIEKALRSLSLTLPAVAAKDANPMPTTTRTPLPFSADTETTTWYSYAELTGYPSVATGKKPCLLRFMDGTTLRIASWKHAACEVTQRICNDYGLPQLPFNGGIQGLRYFINTTPTHVTGEEMSAASIQVAGKTVYMHTNRSTQNFAKCLISLFQAVGAPQDVVKVSIG